MSKIVRVPIAWFCIKFGDSETMTDYSVRDVEQAGVSVNSILSLFSCDDLDRGKLTALINSVDTGFNTSFTSTSPTKIMIQSLFNQHSSEILISEFAATFKEVSRGTQFTSMLSLLLQALAGTP